MESTNEEIDKCSKLSPNQNDVVVSPLLDGVNIDQSKIMDLGSKASSSSAVNEVFENSSDSIKNLQITTDNSTSEVNIENIDNKCNMKKNHKNNCKRFNRSNSNYSSKSGKNQTNRVKKRTRRGKSKRQPNKPYHKTGFKFLRPKSCPNSDNCRLNLFTNQPLVPYNTNKFLMEFHAAEIPPLSPGRTRNSSLSIESDDNYFYSLPEDEMEFLTKEFSCVYENARCETLATMDKNLLIQQYLQLEAKLEQATRRIEAKDEKLKNLEDAVKTLNAENSELRRKLDLKSNCQHMDSDSDSSSSSSSPSTCSSSSTCSSLTRNDNMMDSDDNNQTQTLANGVLENGLANEIAADDDVYCSPASSPPFAPISSC